MGCLKSCSIHMGWTSTMIDQLQCMVRARRCPRTRRSPGDSFSGKSHEQGKNHGKPLGQLWTTVGKLGKTLDWREHHGKWWNSHQKPNVQTEAIDGKGVLGVGCAPVLLMRRSRWPFCKRQLICWKQGWLVETATSRQEECERIQPRRERIVLETLGSLLHSSY